MADATIVAAVQMRAGEDKDANLNLAEVLVSEAASAGASVVLLPELFNCYGRPEQILAHAEDPRGPTFERLQSWARRFQLELLAASWLVRSPEPGRGMNRLALLGRDGALVDEYVKMHLFEIDAAGHRLCETQYQVAGDRVVAPATRLCRLGLAICYDLRFPELFRRFADEAAELVLLPSAFLDATGTAHWRPLVQARAIENQCYVLAANQWGAPTPGAAPSHGHSLIVDPWGQVLAEGPPDADAVIAAPMDLAHLHEVRRRLPALQHRRL